MDVKLVNRGKEGELYFIGKLDSANAPDVQKITDDISGRFEKVVLNLSRLDYTSSAGLRLILKLQLDMNKKGGELYIKEANKTVLEVFELTGSASFLTFI